MDRADVIVDALFGIGLSRALDARSCGIIEAINDSRRPVLSLDLPSGLNGTTGAIWGACVRADCTIGFVGMKVGCYLGVAPDFVGTLAFDALGLPADLPIAAIANRLDSDELQRLLPRRSKLSHKGMNGHLLVVGGGKGMAGAARLAAEAALRVGAGLVTVATCPESAAVIASGRAELMVRAVESQAALQPLIERADVIAIGPGLGQDPWAQELFTAVTASQKPLVVDADALNLLALNVKQRGDWILTPHPGEAGRLLGMSTEFIQRDRLANVSLLAQRFDAVAVLKGACSWVASPDRSPVVCDRGNPGMAAGGMGDVLTGVIGALASQGLGLWDAARAGVFLHALAGDAAAADGERGMMASDLFPHLRRAANPNA
jgi:NAD(P)H-hydrate epimerase